MIQMLNYWSPRGSVPIPPPSTGIPPKGQQQFQLHHN